MTEHIKSISPESLSVIVATDCGSTTTKAILFEKKADGWHQTFRGEAPTTVEKPVADVTIGVKNAFQELEELSGRRLLADDAYNTQECPIRKKASADDPHGVDLYVSTSSAGGGLQMVVAGVVGSMSTASAERAALGAGAIVMDAISLDDRREQHQRVQKIRHLRPDIVLIAGGTDGGTVSHPLELAETVLQANPRPRFGETLRLPVIYAANKDAKSQAEQILKDRFAFTAVKNLRPTLEEENLDEARDAIHELFLHHVMSHAPGYSKLLNYTPVPILPTPAAFGDMVLTYSKLTKKQTLAVDIGGATTDVFSVFNGSTDPKEFLPIFNRTVSANLGMSYSVANVAIEAGLSNICRWLPLNLSAADVQDRLRNKMIRPTTIPQTLEDLLLEQAICREALRLAFSHHKRLATGLKGARKSKSLADVFREQDRRELADMLNLNLIIGSGGVISHAPDRRSCALMLIDAYEPVGVTELAVDSIFMMPHLGVFSSVHPQAALEIFERDCIVPLGTVIAPTGTLKLGKPMFEVSCSGKIISVLSGEIKHEELGLNETAELTIKPLASHLDFGAGPGKTITTTVRGGHAGLVFDGRCRPIQFSSSRDEQITRAMQWSEQIMS